jgi:hypothetical protein
MMNPFLNVAKACDAPKGWKKHSSEPEMFVQFQLSGLCGKLVDPSDVPVADSKPINVKYFAHVVVEQCPHVVKEQQRQQQQPRPTENLHLQLIIPQHAVRGKKGSNSPTSSRKSQEEYDDDAINYNEHKDRDSILGDGNADNREASLPTSTLRRVQSLPLVDLEVICAAPRMVPLPQHHPEDDKYDHGPEKPNEEEMDFLVKMMTQSLTSSPASPTRQSIPPPPPPWYNLDDSDESSPNISISSCETSPTTGAPIKAATEKHKQRKAERPNRKSRRFCEADVTTPSSCPNPRRKSLHKETSESKIVVSKKYADDDALHHPQRPQSLKVLQSWPSETRAFQSVATGETAHSQTTPTNRRQKIQTPATTKPSRPSTLTPKQRRSSANDLESLSFSASEQQGQKLLPPMSPVRERKANKGNSSGRSSRKLLTTSDHVTKPSRTCGGSPRQSKGISQSEHIRHVHPCHASSSSMAPTVSSSCSLSLSKKDTTSNRTKGTSPGTPTSRGRRRRLSVNELEIRVITANPLTSSHRRRRHSLTTPKQARAPHVGNLIDGS